MPDFSGAATIGGGDQPRPQPGQQPGEQVLVVSAEDLRGEPEAEAHFFSDALREQWDRIKAKEKANQESEAALGKYGWVVDATTYFSIMISSLADILFPETELGQKMRFSWHELVQDRMGAGYKQARSAVVQAALGQGANVPAAWIEELNREARSRG